MGDHDGDQCPTDCQGDWQGWVAMEMQVEWKKSTRMSCDTWWGCADHYCTRRELPDVLFCLARNSFLSLHGGSFICLLNMEPVGSLRASVSSFTSIHQQYIYTSCFAFSFSFSLSPCTITWLFEMQCLFFLLFFHSSPSFYSKPK